MTTISPISSEEAFQALIDQSEARTGYQRPWAFGLGLRRQSQGQQTLDVWYPNPLVNEKPRIAALLSLVTGHLNQSGCFPIDQAAQENLLNALKLFEGQPGHRNLHILKQFQNSDQLVVTFLQEDSPLQSAEEAYLKLHLLSHRKAKPNTLNLEGLFGALNNVAWTSHGPVALDELENKMFELRNQGQSLEIFSIDKFPKMVNYVVPSGVRIADTSRVRLGAYIGEGTTVMHEGQINFNAGTLGASMVEGRISASVVIGNGSDLGGGASTMGTLSGGNDILVSIGEQCLIGANAGINIPLGDRCIVEAGLYVTSGSKLEVISQDGQRQSVKAIELAGQSDLLFRRNSLSGAMECLTNKKAVELNEELHKHN